MEAVMYTHVQKKVLQAVIRLVLFMIKQNMFNQAIMNQPLPARDDLFVDVATLEEAEEELNK